MTRFSQNDEEDVILSFFHGRAPGRFLDIGAHDGIALSNTRALALLGWGGMLVEPSPAPFCALMDTYRHGMVLVHAAICADPGLFIMYDSRGDFVSTFDEHHRGIWAADSGMRKGVTYQPIVVAGITIAQLTDKFPGPYAFVNLDVEGINLELFNQLKLAWLGVELVCVEYQDKLREMDEIASAQGYRRLHVTSENALYAKR